MAAGIFNTLGFACEVGKMRPMILSDKQMSEHIDALVSAALQKDIGDGEFTAALISKDAQA